MSSSKSSQERLTQKLGKIKEGALSRGFALAKISMAAGAQAASYGIGNLLSSQANKPERLKTFLTAQMSLLARELGQLKGSVMKVGQMLSVLGEHLLPAEANALLKSLQSQSPALEWKAVERVLKRQLGSEKLALLEIDPEPVASASLGQVHRARHQRDGRLLALKIQYPGVDRAIESDLKLLRSLLSMTHLIPKGPKYDELFYEVREMLEQEVDYRHEFTATRAFRQALVDDPHYIVPEVDPEFSTDRVLTTSYEEGIAIDSPEIMALSQERRNAIGFAALSLYFRELFQLGRVQTDPHFGNYRVRLGVGGKTLDQLILLDFGAVRELSAQFREPYYELVRGSFLGDRKLLEKGAHALGFLKKGDSPELKNCFSELCDLFMEPFLEGPTSKTPPGLFDREGTYDWGQSDLPKRVIKKGAELALTFKLRTPPREIVFLDRKMGGVFVFLSVLKVKLRSRELLEEYLKNLISIDNAMRRG